MPIPFLGVIAVLGGLYGVDKVITADEKMTSAKRINREAQDIADKVTKRCDEARNSTNDTLVKLGRTKLSIIAGSIHDFVENFSRIRNIDREDNTGLENLRNFKNDFRELEKASFNATELMSGGVGSITAGALTAAGAYGAVGALATGSTGTAISALSGAAATNATLAWLGGGAIAAGGGGMAMGTMVLGGLVAAPALIVMGLFMGAKADEALSKAESQRDEANKYAQDVKNACTVMEAISARAEQIKSLLEDMNDIFRPLVNRMTAIIDKRGTDWRNYSQGEKDLIGNTWQIAATIKRVIDTSLMKENGEFDDYNSQNALQAGQKLFAKHN